MANPLAQFVVNQLIPEGRNEQGRAYQLNEASVSPVRVIQIDDDGNELEETICALAKSAKFVDRDGNICDVPLRTGRVFSMEPEAERYEQIVVHDIIRGGQMPLESCPFTNEFRHIKGGPLIKPRDASDVDCGGRPGAQRLHDACPHMQKVIAERRERARIRTMKEDDKMRVMRPDDVAQLVKTLGEAFGDKLAAQAKPGRANIRDGKGEKLD